MKYVSLIRTALLVLMMCLGASGVQADSSQFYAGYCTRYAAQRFDGVAPSPHCNWGGDAHRWITNADAKGWKTVTSVTSPKVGAVVVWSGGSYGHVAYVTGWNSSGITIAEMNYGPTTRGGGLYYGAGETSAQFNYRKANAITDNWNRVTTATLSYASVSSRGGNSSMSFVGYVLPERKGSGGTSLPSDLIQVYRLRYVPNGTHMYTVSSSELAALVGTGQWVQESPAFRIRQNWFDGSAALQRFCNRNNGLHVYLVNQAEVNAFNANSDWRNEGVMGFVASPDNPQPQGSRTLFRYANMVNGDHLWTIFGAEEIGVADQPGQMFGDWLYQGGVCFVWP